MQAETAVASNHDAVSGGGTDGTTGVEIATSPQDRGALHGQKRRHQQPGNTKVTRLPCPNPSAFSGAAKPSSAGEASGLETDTRRSGESVPSQDSPKKIMSKPTSEEWKSTSRPPSPTTATPGAQDVAVTERPPPQAGHDENVTSAADDTAEASTHGEGKGGGGDGSGECEARRLLERAQESVERHGRHADRRSAEHLALVPDALECLKAVLPLMNDKDRHDKQELLLVFHVCEEAVFSAMDDCCDDEASCRRTLGLAKAMVEDMLCHRRLDEVRTESGREKLSRYGDEIDVLLEDLSSASRHATSSRGGGGGGAGGVSNDEPRKLALRSSGWSEDAKVAGERFCEQLFASLQPDVRDFEKLEAIRKYAERALRGRFYEGRVLVFGSSAMQLSVPESDVDLVLHLPSRMKLIQELKDNLEAKRRAAAVAEEENSAAAKLLQEKASMERRLSRLEGPIRGTRTDLVEMVRSRNRTTNRLKALVSPRKDRPRKGAGLNKKNREASEAVVVVNNGGGGGGGNGDGGVASTPGRRPSSEPSPGQPPEEGEGDGVAPASGNDDNGTGGLESSTCAKRVDPVGVPGVEENGPAAAAAAAIAAAADGDTARSGGGGSKSGGDGNGSGNGRHDSAGGVQGEEEEKEEEEGLEKSSDEGVGEAQSKLQEEANGAAPEKGRKKRLEEEEEEEEVDEEHQQIVATLTDRLGNSERKIKEANLAVEKMEAALEKGTKAFKEWIMKNFDEASPAEKEAVNVVCTTRASLESAERKLKATSKIVFEMKRILERKGFTEVMAVHRSRVPVVKTRAPHSLCHPFGRVCSVDICVNNLLAVHNTRFIKTYTELDPRCHRMLYVVKAWSKARGVNDSAKGTLSSYAHCVTVLHYLIRVGVVPCLLKDHPSLSPNEDNPKATPAGRDGADTPILVEGIDVSFSDPTGMGMGTGNQHPRHGQASCRSIAERQKGKNPKKGRTGQSQSPEGTTSASGLDDGGVGMPLVAGDAGVCDLLLGYFRYCDEEFCHAKQVMSLRPKGVLDKARVWSKPLLWRTSVEDPFMTFDSSNPHDLGWVLSRQGQALLREEWKRGHSLLRRGAMEELLEPCDRVRAAKSNAERKAAGPGPVVGRGGGRGGDGGGGHAPPANNTISRSAQGRGGRLQSPADGTGHGQSRGHGQEQPTLTTAGLNHRHLERSQRQNQRRSQDSQQQQQRQPLQQGQPQQQHHHQQQQKKQREQQHLDKRSNGAQRHQQHQHVNSLQGQQEPSRLPAHDQHPNRVVVQQQQQQQRQPQQRRQPQPPQPLEQLTRRQRQRRRQQQLQEQRLQAQRQKEQRQSGRTATVSGRSPGSGGPVALPSPPASLSQSSHHQSFPPQSTPRQSEESESRPPRVNDGGRVREEDQDGRGGGGGRRGRRNRGRRGRAGDRGGGGAQDGGET